MARRLRLAPPAPSPRYLTHVLQSELDHDKRPNGIRRENARGSIPADPAALPCPVLMIYGSAAGQAAYMHGGIQRAEYFEKLPTGDKALVVIPGGGDYAHLQRPRRRLYTAIADFLLAG